MPEAEVAKSTKKNPAQMEQDFTPLLETKLPENKELAKQGRIVDAIENLLVLEKQTRNAEDAIATSKVAVAIIDICLDAKNWDLLSEKLVQLTKRRGQLKTVVKDMVQRAMTYLDNIPDEPIRLALIDTLRTITEGKIYVENERARLTRILAAKKESEGKIGEAAQILQEVQVETFGAMERNEKTDFLLEQMRLCLDNKDYIRAQLLSNKVNRRILNEADFQELKHRFYNLLIRYYSHNASYLDICRSYQSIYEIPIVRDNKPIALQTLKMIALYICLSAYSNEQQDLLHRIYNDKALQELALYRELVKCFITQELVRWPLLLEIYGPELSQHSIFPAQRDAPGSLWSDLAKRVIEHNIRIVAKYYSSITFKRLSELLDLSASETEKSVSELVVSKSIYAKIDRLKGIVIFTKRQEANDLLNDWSDNVAKLLEVIENTTHLIHRENMIHKV